MAEKCWVCNSEININDTKCPVCGFADLHKDFISKEDAENWMKTVVEPYRNEWYPDEPQEIRELRKRANSGDAVAQNNLGVRYRDGDGVERDCEKALHWYRKSAEQGNAMAQYHIAVFYDNGAGVPLDYSIAAQWKEKAAKAGCAIAQLAIGRCYEIGKGVQKDEIKAVYWYKKAAEQGQKTAQNNLGLCYQKGIGVTKDINMAICYYEQAIENGSEVAAHNLACVYDKITTEYPNDYEKAFKYYKLAEERGYSIGTLFNNIGRLYADGQGVERNDEMARKYYEKAISMGNITARDNLNLLGNNKKQSDEKFSQYEEPKSQPNSSQYQGSSWSGEEIGWAICFALIAIALIGLIMVMCESEAGYIVFGIGFIGAIIVGFITGFTHYDFK